MLCYTAVDYKMSTSNINIKQSLNKTTFFIKVDLQTEAFLVKYDCFMVFF